MPFKPGIFQKVQNVIFSRKTVKISHPSITFNTTPVAWQKYTIPETSWLVSWWKIKFQWSYPVKISEANKGIGIVKNLWMFFQKTPLITETSKKNLEKNKTFCMKIYIICKYRVAETKLGISKQNVFLRSDHPA